MAGGHGLSQRRIAATLAALTVGVLALHWVGLEGLVRLQAAAQGRTALKAMGEPMFTRVLQPEAPPPIVAAATPAPGAPQAPAASPGSLAVAVAPAAAPVAASEATPVPAPQADAAQADPEPTPEAAAVAAPAIPPAPPATSAPPAPPADTWPRDSRVTYTVSGQFRGGGVFGSGGVQWQRQGTLYQARVDLDFGLLGGLVMTSQGEIGPQSLVPRVYEEQRGRRRRSVRLSDTEVVLQDGRSLARPSGVQDAASQFVELGHRFATGQQVLALGALVELPLARPGGLDTWTYEVVAQDLLQTPRLGEVVAWRLKPRPLAQPRGNIVAEFWFAPSLQYLPARIRLTMGDEATIDLMVDTIEQRDTREARDMRPAPTLRPPP